ncbi:hypothetical protein BCR42DRAFT_428870 [Absidia repens]|uniref:Uncharacterized protein n=1 Tax=Absidia repens TaxID=90262 RepID=A0A1X2HXU7_9FUNG|nr:hypothetical protein BCR42DRAFT_428870 [Absidia repens]
MSKKVISIMLILGTFIYIEIVNHALSPSFFIDHGCNQQTEKDRGFFKEIGTYINLVVIYTGKYYPVGTFHFFLLCCCFSKMCCKF